MAEAATFFAYDPKGRLMRALFYRVHDDGVYEVVNPLPLHYKLNSANKRSLLQNRFPSMS